MKTTNRIRKSPVRELLALTLVPNLGAYRISLLLQEVDHPQDIFRMNKAELEAIDGIGTAVSGAITAFNDWEKVDQLLKRSNESKARIINCLDDHYPPLLKELYDPPILLWVAGNPDVLHSQGLAVVGTRRATDYGKRMAARFAAGMVEHGLAVVSGLAYGIDAVAHKTALKEGGKTIAVLGSGIDNIYPAKHRGLASDIARAGGAVISEFPPGTKPDAGNFPIRNRVVSGLTLGTLVIESGLQGGSMITARSALDQNREVFVVPHSLDNRNGEGCNAILKRGWGKLVQDMDDILDEVPVRHRESDTPDGTERAAWKEMELDELSVAICSALDELGTTHIDELAEYLDKPTHLLLPKLLELEMKGCIRQSAGKNFELI